jgi:hypothetical protein
MNIRRKSAVLLRLAFGVFAIAYILVTIPNHVSANQITARSLTLQAGVTDGGSKAGGVVNHFFQFTLPAVGGPSVGSIKFLYCTTAIGSCTTPAGLSTTGATMGSQNRHLPVVTIERARY